MVLSGGDKRGEDGDKGGEPRGKDPKKSLLSGRSRPFFLRGTLGLTLPLMLMLMLGWATDSKTLPWLPVEKRETQYVSRAT